MQAINHPGRRGGKDLGSGRGDICLGAMDEPADTEGIQGLPELGLHFYDGLGREAQRPHGGDHPADLSHGDGDGVP